jgi:uncharacterized membrane protein YgaE (UPF0421/DUF939 family)
MEKKEFVNTVLPVVVGSISVFLGWDVLTTIFIGLFIILLVNLLLFGNEKKENQPQPQWQPQPQTNKT